jgi:hypothetical protein
MIDGGAAGGFRGCRSMRTCCCFSYLLGSFVRFYLSPEEGAVFRQSFVSGLVLAFVARVEAREGKQGSQREGFTLEHVDFEPEEAGLPPVGYRDHVDQFSLMRGLRLKVALKGGDVCSKAGLGRSVGEQGCRGAETMPAAVSGGVGFTLGGDGSTGFGAVGARGGGAAG